MELRTKNPVLYNDGMAGNITGLLVGIIKNYSRIQNNYFGANYQYNDDQGQAKFEGGFTLNSRQEIIDTYDLIKNDLPPYDVTPEPDYEELKTMFAFRLKMFEELLTLNPGLLITDIEII